MTILKYKCKHLGINSADISMTCFTYLYTYFPLTYEWIYANCEEYLSLYVWYSGLGLALGLVTTLLALKTTHFFTASEAALPDVAGEELASPTVPVDGCAVASGTLPVDACILLSATLPLDACTVVDCEVGSEGATKP